MRLFKSYGQKIDFAAQVESHEYGLYMLHPEYAEKTSLLRRGPVVNGKRVEKVHVFTPEEMKARTEDVKTADLYIRASLQEIGVSQKMLDRLDSRQLYYYVLGIVHA